MVKLNKQIISLSNVVESIEIKIGKQQAKIAAIDAKCAELNRDYTTSENNKVMLCMAEIEELLDEIIEIHSVIDILSIYSDITD